VIVRPGAGGVCASLWNHLSELCVVAGEIGASPWAGGHGGHEACSFTLFQAASLVCRARFPPPATRPPVDPEGPIGSPPPTEGLTGGSAREASVVIDANDAGSGSGNGGDGISAVEVAELMAKLTRAFDDMAQEGFLPATASHPTPLILTSTGGEARTGQVASALVLRGAEDGVHRGATAAIAAALRGALADYCRALAKAPTSGRHVDRVGNSDSGGGEADGGSSLTTTAAPSCPESVSAYRAERSAAAGDVHAALMTLAAATIRVVTCGGTRCEPSGRDYDDLIAALKWSLDHP
jgi:hypothetical protein